MLEYATALKTLNRKLEFLVNYLNGLPVGKKRHKFGTAYLDWLNEKDEKGLKDHLKLLNDLYSQDCPFRRDLFSGIKLPEEFQGSCSVPSSCSHPLSASNTLIDIVCQLHIKAGKHATMFREESEKMRIAEQRKCNVDDARKKQKLDQPFIDTHGFQEVSSEQWREWRNLPAITVARQQYDEMFWQGKQKDLPKACFKENAKLPEWPSFKTTVVDKYIDAITKTAPLWRALVQNIHDRWPKNLRVISHKYVRDFFRMPSLRTRRTWRPSIASLIQLPLAIPIWTFSMVTVRGGCVGAGCLRLPRGCESGSHLAIETPTSFVKSTRRRFAFTINLPHSRLRGSSSMNSHGSSSRPL